MCECGGDFLPVTVSPRSLRLARLSGAAGLVGGHGNRGWAPDGRQVTCGSAGSCHSEPRPVTTVLAANLTRPLKSKEAIERTRTILFTVETQEELRRGFYPSIGGALG